MTNSETIGVGVVGLSTEGLHWSTVAEKTRSRAAVRAVWDGVAARAALVEREAERRDGDRFHTAPAVCSSITKLAERRGIKAAVVLDAGWAGFWAARRIADEGHSVLWLADWPHRDAWNFRGIGRDLVVPGLRLRYCPATIRLRELIATHLGPIEAIRIRQSATTEVWELVDWASAVMNSSAVDVEQAGDVVRVHLRTAADVDITLKADASESEGVSAQIRGTGGVATWCPPDHISWKPTDGSDTVAVETTSDRDAVTVLLDLFLRRVVGGLVPVPSVDDVERADRLSRSVSIA